MKNKISKLLEYLIVLCLGILIGLNLYSPLDVNRDRKINAIDYVIVKNYIMRGCDNNG